MGSGMSGHGGASGEAGGRSLCHRDRVLDDSTLRGRWSRGGCSRGRNCRRLDGPGSASSGSSSMGFPSTRFSRVPGGSSSMGFPSTRLSRMSRSSSMRFPSMGSPSTGSSSTWLVGVNVRLSCWMMSCNGHLHEERSDHEEKH